MKSLQVEANDCLCIYFIEYSYGLVAQVVRAHA